MRSPGFRTIPLIEQVVAAFSDRDQRLLVTGHDPVRGRIAEVSHEALIRNWGELRQLDS